MPFTLLPLQLEAEIFTPKYSIFTRYGKKLINSAYYGKITIEGHSIEVEGHSVEVKENVEERRDDSSDETLFDVEGNNDE